LAENGNGRWKVSFNGALLFAILIQAGIIAYGYGELSQKVVDLQRQVDRLENLLKEHEDLDKLRHQGR